MRVNALKVITCLSEAPEGREWLIEHVPKVNRDENLICAFESLNECANVGIQLVCILHSF